MCGPPSVVGGRIYVADTSCCSGGRWISAYLIALDEAAAQNCSGAPKTCQPVATKGTSVGGLSLYVGPPAVAHGTLYANDGRLLALTGAQLSDLWTGTGIVISSPTHANGVVYTIGGVLVGGTSQIRLFPVAYDAAGNVGCSGSPKSCAPLWSGAPGPPVDVLATVFSDLVGPTIADGSVYVRTDRLRAYWLRMQARADPERFRTRRARPDMPPIEAQSVIDGPRTVGTPPACLPTSPRCCSTP